MRKGRFNRRKQRGLRIEAGRQVFTEGNEGNEGAKQGGRFEQEETEGTECGDTD
jgi:hypothetical protein